MNGRLTSVIPGYAFSEYAELQYTGSDDRERIQDSLLSKHISYCVAHSPYYRSKFKSLSIDPVSINCVNDLTRLPFTSKSDLQNFDRFLAVKPGSIADICYTSGTTGNPLPVMQTRMDLARLAYNEAEAFAMAGLTSDDTVLICTAMGTAFMAGMAYFLGGLQLGCTMIRGGSSSAGQNWSLIQQAGATAVIGVPGMLKRIADYGKSLGVSPERSTVKRLIAIGDAVRDQMMQPLPLTRSLEELWDAEVYSTYASTEMATAFCECEARSGGHLRPELVVIEIVDEDGRKVRDGTAGEVIATPLGVTGMPLIRFRTGDIASLITEPCTCGRKTGRLSPVLGRLDQRLKVKGTTLYPGAIVNLIAGHPLCSGACVEASTKSDGSDDVKLYLALKDPSHVKTIFSLVKDRLRVTLPCVVVTEHELESMTCRENKRKPVTFIDNRQAKSL